MMKKNEDSIIIKLAETDGEKLVLIFKIFVFRGVQLMMIGSRKLRHLVFQDHKL